MITERQEISKVSSLDAPANCLELGSAGKGSPVDSELRSQKIKVNRLCRTKYWRGENFPERKL